LFGFGRLDLSGSRRFCCLLGFAFLNLDRLLTLRSGNQLN
jgi:hypothetical protein